MPRFLSSDLALFILILVLTVLFLLQIWAILRIKIMLHQVSEIFRFVRAASLGTRNRLSPRRPHAARICEHCRYRTTYLANDAGFELLYHCKKHNKPIELNHTCRQFEFDEQDNKI